jgi:uncharacterized cupin superfamily protein
MVEERDGWFVVNVKDSPWYTRDGFGMSCEFAGGKTFPQTGVRIFMLEPGKPNCRYHREEAQEDFLVLSGNCKMLVNDEEAALQAWDYFHCPPGVTHVLLGGAEPCAVLAIGHRPEKESIFYPFNEKAAACNAQAPEETPDPKVAYSDVPSWEPGETPEWPPKGG